MTTPGFAVAPETPPVLVAGDVRIDVLMARELTGGAAVRFVKQAGGAALLARIFRYLAGAAPALDPGASLPDALEAMGPDDIPHACVELERYPRVAGAAQKPDDPPAGCSTSWRR